MNATRLSFFIPALSMVLASGTKLFAAASVTAATGGGAIAADTAGGAYATLTGPKLTETDKTGIGVGSIILTAPAGFEFNPTSPVTVSVTGRGKGTNLILSNTVAVVTTNSITVHVASTSVPNSKRSILTWSGIKVRPKAGSPLANGNIAKSGTASYTESGSAGNYGTLAEVPGAMSNLVVTLPNQTFTSGSGVSGTPAEVTAGVPFNITRLTAADRFLNIVTNYNGDKTISYAGPGGAPAYTTNVTFTNGVSSTTLATTLRKAETTTVTASDGTTTGPASSPLTVNRGGVAKLQLLAPGETASPGTLSGKNGTPTGQAAGAAFTVMVRAVDDNWNLVDAVTDTVAITSSDANANLPPSAALAGGTGVFSLVLLTAGGQTVTASDISAPTITGSTCPPIAVSPASLQRLQLLVPGETAAPGTAGGKTGVPTGEVVGVAFTVTVHAVDAFCNVVPASDFVGITSSDSSATLPANSALVDGSQFFSLTLNSQGAFTLTATDLSNASVTNDTSPLIAVTAGPFTKLQLLVPGEVTAPGTSTGKTGTPWPQSAGVAFPITVNAVDDHWNLANTVTEVVHFASSDPAAGLPSDTALAGGTGTFSVTLGTVGSQTITVSDATDGTKVAGTSSVVRVGIATFQPAAGGSAISADTTGGAYTSLSGPIILEGSSGNIGAGSIVLTMPDGFLINTGSTVLVSVTGNGAGSDLVLASATATVSSTTITVTVNTPSTGQRVSTLTWSGIQIRPAAGFPLASGAISNSGTATLSGVPAGSDFGTLTETPGTPDRLTIQTQPSATATAGAPFAPQPVIRIEDQFGNLCMTDNSTVVTAARGSGAGILQGSLSAIAVSGVVSFANLSHLVAGSITLVFSVPGLPVITSDGIVVSPATASQLVFVQPPTNAIAGSAITPSVTLQVQDAFSNAVAGSGVPVSVSLNSGSGVLSGTRTNLTDAYGLAAFNDLTVDRAGLKTLAAASPSLAQVESDAFTIFPAAASQLIFLQPPTNAVAGATITPPVTVQVQDVFGNAVTNAGVSISLILSAGAGTLAGTTPQATDPLGIATFGDLSIAAAGSKALTAAGAGLTSAVSSVFTISPSAYTRMQILVPGETAAPGTATGKTGTPALQTAGAPFTARVNAVDDFWNIVNTVSNTVDLYSSDAGATYLPASAALAAGASTFSVTLNTGGNQTLSAEDLTDQTIADDTSSTITVAVISFTLQIISDHGTAVPLPGVYTNAVGTTLTNTATGFEIQGGTQYICKGWVMAGNDPTSGSDTNCVLTLTNNAVLTWLWTNYRFNATAAANGMTTGATNGWYESGGSVTVTGVPNLYYHLSSWTGDVPSFLMSSNPLTMTMSQERSVLAMFLENLGSHYGTPYTWLARYGFTNNMDSAELLIGSNGIPVWESYICDLNPTNALSLLRIASLSTLPPLTMSLSFASSTGRWYTLECSTNLMLSNAWFVVPGQSNLLGNGGVKTLIDTNTYGLRFYRIQVQLPQ